jgi:hypothetical protein
MFAASAVAFGTMAFGQTQMKAEIPFAFRTPNATLPAGSYLVSEPSTNGVTRLLQFRNTSTRQAAVAISNPIDLSRTAGAHPSVLFLCNSDGCTLSAIKTFNGTFNYPVHNKSAREKEALTLRSIPLTALNGE